MKKSNPLVNLSAAIYGTIAYVLGLGTILYLIGFVDNVLVPKSLDTGGVADESVIMAVVIDVLLVALFGLQHSLMARPAFKRAWTRIVPAPIERSTYVVFASAVLGLLMWQWRRDSRHGVGVRMERNRRHGGDRLRGLGVAVPQHVPHQPFRTVRIAPDVRQDLQLRRQRTGVPHAVPVSHRAASAVSGFLLAMWAAPKMTLGHLLFSSLMTIYIVFAISLEESDLIDVFGNAYVKYREKVGMLFPQLRRG